MSSAEFTPVDFFDSQAGFGSSVEKLKVFLEDYQSFEKINNLILKGVVIPERPEGSVDIDGWTRCDKNVFSPTFNKFLALKNLGYGIYLSDDVIATEENKMLYRGLLNISVSPEDKTVIELINHVLLSMSRNRSNRYLNLIQLIEGVDSRLDGQVLSSNNVNSLVANRELRGFPEEERLPTLKRAFLTSLLLDSLDFDHWEEYDSGGRVPHSKLRLFNDGYLYAVLKSQGFEPFNPEEIYGMVSTVIKMTVSNKPEI